MPKYGPLIALDADDSDFLVQNANETLEHVSPVSLETLHRYEDNVIFDKITVLSEFFFLWFEHRKIYQLTEKLIFRINFTCINGSCCLHVKLIWYEKTT